MTLKKEIFLVVLTTNIFITYSQTPQLTKKDSTIVSSWMVGLGFNAIDDAGDIFDNLFDVKDTWNAVPYPSRLSIGRYFKNGLGVEAIAAYNKYKKGKTVDDIILAEDKNYFSVDSRLSYDLNKIIGETGWFDPYIGVGVGYTHANNISRGTYNAVVGFRTWFSDRFGLDLNSSGKWSMDPDASNHLQHAIGVVYRFNTKKDLTKKGEVALELIKAIEKENTRIKDSTVLANKLAEENRVLKERLEKEKEKARLAQLEKEKQERREKERTSLQNDLDALETIYFSFDSSYITATSKNVLSELAVILNKHPKLLIEISSHTDSRGSAPYNQKLSERRLQSTLNYLFKTGVDSAQVEGKAYGEEKLVNECDDHTKCPETKHKENRRSEFKIINF